MFILHDVLEWLKDFPSLIFLGEPKFPTED